MREVDKLKKDGGHDAHPGPALRRGARGLAKPPPSKPRIGVGLTCGSGNGQAVFQAFASEIDARGLAVQLAQWAAASASAPRSHCSTCGFRVGPSSSTPSSRTTSTRSFMVRSGASALRPVEEWTTSPAMSPATALSRPTRTGPVLQRPGQDRSQELRPRDLPRRHRGVRGDVPGPQKALLIDGEPLRAAPHRSSSRRPSSVGACGYLTGNKWSSCAWCLVSTSSATPTKEIRVHT